VAGRVVPTPAQSREPQWRHGWPVPSSICVHPEQARAAIHLPAFGSEILERARTIAACFPAAEAEYRRTRGRERETIEAGVPRFERVFGMAARLAGAGDFTGPVEYDELLIVTAWHCVRPGQEGFLGSYPKSLLCPLSHTAPPVALETLTPAQRITFDRRVPYYLRYLVCEKFGLRTCADLEQADLRQLLRSSGFRLIRSSAVPETAFSGITRGEDPPVRPWKLTLRQELSEERAGELLMQAALWQVRHGLRLVTFDTGQPRWNIGAFERTDWEDAFLSLGVSASPAFTRESGQFDWRKVLTGCLERLGTGNLPAEVVGRVTALPQRASHDSQQAIWEVLDRASRIVLRQARVLEPHLFEAGGRLKRETARQFRRWARLFDDVSPNILSRLGVSVFTALRRVAPADFGWGCTQLKPWEVEQEHGKWKGPRGRALLRSAYAYALFEAGLGRIETRGDEVNWVCTQRQFCAWAAETADLHARPYEFLYNMARRHGLTPLLNREISHTAAVSLLAGLNLHDHLPRIEGCWEVCLRAAVEHHGGRLEVRLDLPDLVPLPLRLRKALITPLPYAYLHREVRLVRDFDLRMARETRRPLIELPGWWEDERIVGTPLLSRVSNGDDPVRAVLSRLRPDPWIETPVRKIRFCALRWMLSRQATQRQAPGASGLTSAEMRILLRLVLEATLEHTNLAEVSIPAVRRGLDRLLAREDAREMLDSLLLHVGTAYETQVWGQARQFIVLDVINDLLALTLRGCLLHVMSAE
jgi:hypothetical protein